MPKELSKQQKDFCIYYLETGSKNEAYKKAGYKANNMNTLTTCASQLLRRPAIQEEIKRLQKIDPKTRKEKREEDRHIATAQEVMEFFTKMMNGEIKDQFNLDASNADRIKAAQEIAKRTVDLDNRANGKADGVLQIKVDWSRDNGDCEESESNNE